MKRMKHPLHGFHHALDSNEETHMRLHGWLGEEEDPAQQDQAQEAIEVPEKAKRPYTRKAK